MIRRLLTLACSAALITGFATACGAHEQPPLPFQVTEAGQFEEPWAMTFLPDGRLLVSERKGALKLVVLAQTRTGSTPASSAPTGGAPVSGAPVSNRIGDIGGIPEVDYGGQGGFGDVVLHPQFADNGWVYLSYAEAGEADTRGAAVARAKLTLDDKGGGALSDLQVIWRQVPKVSGRGHYGHRIAFGPDGMLWISSGERQKFDPAQDMQSNLGKIIRLNDDGSVPADNPFVKEGGVAAQVWSLGHRNPLGLAFDGQGRLWEQEMGPKGGDELNLVERGKNYGYPIVSNGDHYDGRVIPDHDTRPEFAAPKASWNPVISPAGLMIYSGDKFPQWKGNGFIGGLSSKSLVRIEFDGTLAREAARYDMGQRIREVEQGPDGNLWLLEDQDDGSGGRLLKLTPAV